MKKSVLDVLVFELAEIRGAVPVEDVLAQKLHERHGSVLLEDRRVVVDTKFIVHIVERPGQILRALERCELGAAEVAHHVLYPKVVDVGFKAHEFGRNGEVLVDEGGERNNGFGDEASVLIVDDGGDGHKVEFVGEE